MCECKWIEHRDEKLLLLQHDSHVGTAVIQVVHADGLPGLVRAHAADARGKVCELGPAAGEGTALDGEDVVATRNLHARASEGRM